MPQGQPLPAARPEQVRQLQRKLFLAAKRCETRRFHALYDRIYRTDVLTEAWRRVRANRGAAGIDQQTLAEIARYLNPVLRGWHQYFRIGNSSEKFQSLERYLRFRVALYQKAKHKFRRRRLIRSQELIEMGFYSLLTGVSYDGRKPRKLQDEGSRKAV